MGPDPLSKGERTRSAILDEALGIVSVDGLAGLTIGGLARSVGMSKSGLFAHFSSKEALELAVLQHASDRFVERVIAPALKAPRGPERLEAFFERTLAWENSEFPGACPIQAAAEQYDDRPGPAQDFVVGIQRDLFDSARTMVQAGIEAHALRADLDPDQVAFELLALLAGYHRYRRSVSRAKAEQHTRRAFEALMNRLRT